MRYLKKFNESFGEIKNGLLLDEEDIPMLESLVETLNGKFKILGLKFKFYSITENRVNIIEIALKTHAIENSLMDIIVKSNGASDALPFHKESNIQYIERIGIIISRRNKEQLPVDKINRIGATNSNVLYHFIKIGENEDVLNNFLKEMLVAFENLSNKYIFFPKGLNMDNMNQPAYQRFTREMPYLHELIISYIKNTILNTIDYTQISNLLLKIVQKSNSYQVFTIIKKLYPEIWNKIETNSILIASELGDMGF